MSTLKDFRLDPSIFNQELYTSLLELWVPNYPTPSAKLDKSKMMSWFMKDDVFDGKCRSTAKHAVDAIGPDKYVLPPFESFDEDRRQYGEFAAPFMSQFTGPSFDGKEDTRARDEAALGICLLLDQMPRNLFRGADQGVVYTHYDRIARAVSHMIRKHPAAANDVDDGDSSTTKGLDQCARFYDAYPWRLWFYMPLEHSEDVRDHELFGLRMREMVARATELGDEEALSFCKTGLDVGERHLAPLKQFGRYPWRNQWIPRESTPEEKRYLEEGGETFGTS